MAVKRFDSPHANECAMCLEDNGMYILATDYDELLRHRNQLVAWLYDIGAFANGEGDVGTIVARRCRIATKKAEEFDDEHNM